MPLDYPGRTAFGQFLANYAQEASRDQAPLPKYLRGKGLVDTGGEGPVLISCVQHAVYPPVHLDAWPDEDRRSRLVVIGNDLDRDALETSLRAFDRAVAWNS